MLFSAGQIRPHCVVYVCLWGREGEGDEEMERKEREREMRKWKEKRERGGWGNGKRRVLVCIQSCNKPRERQTVTCSRLLGNQLCHQVIDSVHVIIYLSFWFISVLCSLSRNTTFTNGIFNAHSQRQMAFTVSEPLDGWKEATFVLSWQNKIHFVNAKPIVRQLNTLLSDR